jgi:hypothetical protein
VKIWRSFIEESSVVFVPIFVALDRWGKGSHGLVEEVVVMVMLMELITIVKTCKALILQSCKEGKIGNAYKKWGFALFLKV